MAEGEMPDVGQQVRELREQRGLSLRALSRLSGLSINAISLIERGTNSPTVSSLHLLANALNVPITDFFQNGTKHTVVFLRPEERMRAEAGGIALESLGSGLYNQQAEPFFVTVEPGAGNIARPITHAGEEFVYCLDGEITYKVGEQVYLLQPGCTLLFNADLAHGFSNEAELPARLLMVFHTAEGGHLARRLHLKNGEENIGE